VGTYSGGTFVRLTGVTRVHTNIPLTAALASDFITPIAAGTPGAAPVYVKDLSSTAIAIGLTGTTQTVVVNFTVPENYLSDGQFEVQYRYAADTLLTMTASVYTTVNYDGTAVDGSKASGAQGLTLTATGLPVTLRWSSVPNTITYNPGAKVCVAISFGNQGSARDAVLNVHGFRFKFKPYGVLN
jgi:hypothetical protein